MASPRAENASIDLVIHEATKSESALGTSNNPADVVAISRSAHPTSANAALRALPKSGSKRKRVYDFINRVGGATDEEIEQALDISGNTVRPTRGSLVKDGFIVDSGLERLTKAGNPAIVWRVA